MLDKLKSGLREAVSKISKANYIDKNTVEDFIKDIQRLFLSGDVDVKLVFEFSEKIKKRALNEKPEPGITTKEHVLKIIYEELVKFVGGHAPEIDISKQKILLVGLFGAGKTSFSAKLAKFYKAKGLTVGLIGCDTHRPAAMTQIKQLASQIDVPVYTGDEKNPYKILQQGMEKLKKDVIIVDSAGRDSFDKELAEEIKKLENIFQPTKVFLVLPADIGQAAGDQAKKFKEYVNINGVVVTKMDATAKGGGALVACAATNAKIKFLSVGEKPDDIEVYDPKKFVSNLLGMPDLKTLIEKAHKSEVSKITSADFSLDEFIEQISGMKKIGSLSQIADMIGFGSKVKKNIVDVQEEKMKKWKHIIKSMTKDERADPNIINTSRISRIATGSGTKESDVREMIANYKKTKKMMKAVNPKSFRRGQFSQLFKQLGMKF